MQIVSGKKIYFQPPKKVKTRQDLLINNWFEAIKSETRNGNMTHREAGSYALGTGGGVADFGLDAVESQALIASIAQKKAFCCSNDPTKDELSLFFIKKNYMPVFESNYAKSSFLSRVKIDELKTDSVVIGHIVSGLFDERLARSFTAEKAKENENIFFDIPVRKRIGVQVRSFIKEEAELSNLMKQIHVCTESKNIEPHDFLFFCESNDRMLVSMLAKRFLVGDVVKTYTSVFFPPLQRKKIFSNLDAMILFSERAYGDVELEAACCCCPIMAPYKSSSDWVRKSIEGIVFLEKDRYGLHRAMLNLPISLSELMNGSSKKRLHYNTFNVLAWQHFSSKMRILPKTKD